MQLVPTAPTIDRVIDDFRAHSCAWLGPVLDVSEVALWRERFARDMQQYRVCWRYAGADITNNVDILTSMPDIDQLIRHPRILDALRTLFGTEPLFWETSARHLTGLQGDARRERWHRDFGESPAVIQAMFLFTDVTPETHCLKVVPRARTASIRSFEDEFADRGERECLTPAGGVWLFDPNCYHSPCQRGSAERISLHTYYCTADGSMPQTASQHSTVPARLWRDGDDAARAFYRLAPHGLRTALMSQAFEG